MDNNYNANTETKGLTVEHLKELARHVKDKKAAESFHWFADHVTLFTFQTYDHLTLQGYFLPSISNTSNNDQSKESTNNKPVFLHCVGYIESTVKYASYLNHIHQLGFDIYSFDLRHQGFSHNYPVRMTTPSSQKESNQVSSSSSSNSSHDSNDGTDETITHVTSFQETYVRDLEQFIKQFIHPHSKRIIYSGNSMSCLIGLLLQSQSASVSQSQAEVPIFEKMILFTPAIMPRVPTLVHYLLYLFTNVGLANQTATKFEMDMSKSKLTHCSRKLDTWILMHSMFPRQFKVVGLTFGFMYEFVKAGYMLLASAHKISVPLLFVQADDDLFVDNRWMNMYCTACKNSPLVKMLRYKNTFHEILVETDDIVDQIMIEIDLFLKV